MPPKRKAAIKSAQASTTPAKKAKASKPTKKGKTTKAAVKPSKQKGSDRAKPKAKKSSPAASAAVDQPKAAGKTVKANVNTMQTGMSTHSLCGKFSLSSLLTEPGWAKAMSGEMAKDYFRELEAKLSKDYSQNSVQVFPPQHLIFNAFNLTPLSQVKVVILGQDPYHDDDQAHGLCFSVPEEVKAPPSLRNMFKELETDVSDFTMPDHGCLEAWAQQGVLLLNATLTVEAHKPNSHKSYGWQKFTDEVIRVVSSQCSKVVFLLWGNFAHKKEALVDTGRHVVLKDAHPSPLSFGKFQNCKCFSRANEALKKAGIKSVDWRL